MLNERCVICGSIIPEGDNVCGRCKLEENGIKVYAKILDFRLNEDDCPLPSLGKGDFLIAKDKFTLEMFFKVYSRWADIYAIGITEAGFQQIPDGTKCYWIGLEEHEWMD